MNLSSETIIDASADRVWEVVGHRFAQIGEWATARLDDRLFDLGERDSRLAHPARSPRTGRATVFLRAYDEAARALTYVGAGLPAFVAEARNRWEV